MPSRFLVVPLALILASALPSSAVSVVDHGDNWRYRKGNSAPQAGWQTLPDASLDATWEPDPAPGGFGYGDGDDATVLADMEGAGGYRTVYIRREFAVAAGALPSDDEVVLSIDYDDAYVAYLDGVEVARSANSPGTVGTEPAFDDGPSSVREAGTAQTTVLGLVAEVLQDGPHVLAVLGMNESDTSSDFSLIVDLVTRTPPPPVHWTLADSPITLTSTFNVAAGQTLIIDAGVEVICPNGADAIDSDGVVRANGTEAQRIRFIPTTPTGTWDRIDLNGPDESAFFYCDFVRADFDGIISGDDSDVRLDHCRFIDVDGQMVDLVNTSCIIEYCEFDSISSGELLHFSDMPSDGHALIAYCRFGLPGVPATGGYNDIVDFTGGNRPGPIPRFIGNVFFSGVDDVFDMDSTDAHIEGNIFMNVNKEGARSSSANPITTGAEDSDDSELVIVRNFFFNCEHNVMIKDHGTVLMQNNTTLTMVPNPFSTNVGEAPGIVMFGEPWRGFPYGDGVYYEGNIAADLQIDDPWPLYTNAPNSTFLRRDFNCIEGFPQPGAGNLSVDPLFVDRADIDASNILQKLALQPGSPCIGTGPNGIDMGAVVPTGASISGEPVGTTSDTGATLTVAGPGIWSYMWRVNGGPWSEEISLVPQAIWDGAHLTDTMFDAAPPIELAGLSDGSYTVEVLGRNSAGDWQETPAVSGTWTVQTAATADRDNDGIPDAYEDANGFDADDPSDAGKDADGDGASNLEEFIAGTMPNDPASVLAIESTAFAGGDVVITFEAVAGKLYQLQSSSLLNSGDWMAVETVPAGSAGQRTITDPGAAGAGTLFYRLVTPAP